jgi:hypothetical protein
LEKCANLVALLSNALGRALERPRELALAIRVEMRASEDTAVARRSRGELRA